MDPVKRQRCFVSMLKQSCICHYTVVRLISDRLVLCVLSGFYKFVTIIKLITVLGSLFSPYQHIYSLSACVFDFWLIA